MIRLSALVLLLSCGTSVSGEDESEEGEQGSEGEGEQGSEGEGEQGSEGEGEQGSEGEGEQGSEGEGEQGSEGEGEEGSEGEGEPNVRLADLAPGVLRDLGRHQCDDLDGAPYACESVTDYSGFAYDSIGHQLLMFGGGHAATVQTDVRVLDLSGDLQWQSAYDSTPFADMTLDNLDMDHGLWRSTGHPLQRHTYDLLNHVAATDRLVLIPGADLILYSQGYPDDVPPQIAGGDVFEYDPNTRIWTNHPRGGWSGYGATSVDPISGEVLILASNGLWSYDPITHTAAQRLSVAGLSLSYAQNMVYAPSTDAHYYLRSDGIVFELRYDRDTPANSTIVEVATTGTRPAPANDVNTFPDSSETGWAYDDRRQRICGGVIAGTMYCFTPTTATFSAHDMVMESNTLAPQRVVFHTLQYDPRNDVFIFITDGAEIYTQHTAAWRPN
jgi:hypothetical protein